MTNLSAPVHSLHPVKRTLVRLMHRVVSLVRASDVSWLPSLRVREHSFRPANWPKGLSLRVLLVADLHACEKWMDESHLDAIVARANQLRPDVVLLLGDYVSAMKGIPSLPGSVWARSLARLHAPLGRFAILGNHDWWADQAAQESGHGPVAAQMALDAVGISVLHNEVVRIEKDDHVVQIAGLGDQKAILGKGGRHEPIGLDDLPGTLEKTDPALPTILMAHEPDIFPEIPPEVSLTVSGHTHGGQLRFLGWSPVRSSDLGGRYSRGHFVEDGRHLVVSAGLGCSRAPLRPGVPPELVVLDLAG